MGHCVSRAHSHGPHLSEPRDGGGIDRPGGTRSV